MNEPVHGKGGLQEQPPCRIPERIISADVAWMPGGEAHRCRGRIRTTSEIIGRVSMPDLRRGIQYQKLPHHAVILMVEQVAMVHVGDRVICDRLELRDEPQRAAGHDDDHILPTNLLRRGIPIFVQNEEWKVMDMEGMGYPGCIGECPYLLAVQRNLELNRIHVKGLLVH
jgi:hypothetical protein